LSLQRRQISNKTMKQTIPKTLFLSAMACPTLGWRMRANELGEETAPTLAQTFRMEQGAEIGRRARKLFPGGVTIDSPDLEMAAATTTELMEAGGPPSLFEATFVVDEYAAKADVLRRDEGGWHLMEVKSNLNPKPELIDDLAYTWMVLRRSGVKISRASFILISKQFRMGMDDSRLFAEHECTAEAGTRAREFEAIADAITSRTSSITMPDPELIPACKTCPLFADCLGRDAVNHILDIPRLSQQHLMALNYLGVSRVEDIPASIELTPAQERVRRAVVSGQPWIGPNLDKSLGEIRWPAHYLDFETVMTALPLFPGIAPYTQVPTQYSIHTCSSVGVIDSHSEYLSDPNCDGRRELAERLIADLPGVGSIVAYSSFEKTTITGLATLFPDLADQLKGLVDRIFDLEAVIRGNYYHPSFGGRTSVKATLPALVPGMSYASLNIGDGDSASAIFALMALGKYSDKEMATISADLLEYCAQDTMAMVKIHQRLAYVSGARTEAGFGQPQVRGKKRIPK
jgi:hypothetical protein